ncbi:MAG: DUF1674 domain-containing protein [Xanthomonadaceae bacterium]|nr:DUF1674 domain-containing protein [Xanthomonadaceae bacterium]
MFDPEIIGQSGEQADAGEAPRVPEQRPAEVGGRDGPEPTRFGDWEKNGRCIDF